MGSIVGDGASQVGLGQAERGLHSISQRGLPHSTKHRHCWWPTKGITLLCWHPRCCLLTYSISFICIINFVLYGSKQLDDHLFYLDPHTVQPASRFPECGDVPASEAVFDTYHCHSPLQMSIRYKSSPLGLNNVCAVSHIFLCQRHRSIPLPRLLLPRSH